MHYLAYASIKKRLDQNAKDVAAATVQLQEALQLGDLSENSEYDAAKDLMRKVTRERDMLTPVLSMPQVKANDSASIFEEGCVIELKLYGMTPEPMERGSAAFNQMVASVTPVFEGILMLGGTLPIQELLTDAALDVETPIGGYLLGKQSGLYSVPVPGGFANISAKKLKSTEFNTEDIHCVYRG